MDKVNCGEVITNEKIVIIGITFILVFTIVPSVLAANITLSGWNSNSVSGCYPKNNLKLKVAGLESGTLSEATLNGYIDHGVDEWSNAGFTISRVASSPNYEVYFGTYDYCHGLYPNFQTPDLARTPITHLATPKHTGTFNNKNHNIYEITS